MLPLSRVPVALLSTTLLLLATRSESGPPTLRIEVGPTGPPVVNGEPIEGDRLSDLIHDARQRDSKRPVTIALARSATIDRLVDIMTGPAGRQLVTHATFVVELPAPSGRSDTARIAVAGAPAVVWLTAGSIRVSANGDSFLAVDGVEDLHSFSAMSIARDPSQVFVLAVDPETDPRLVSEAVAMLRRAHVETLYQTVDDGFELAAVPEALSAKSTKAPAATSTEKPEEADLEEIRRKLLAEMSRLEEPSDGAQVRTDRSKKEEVERADPNIPKKELRRELVKRFQDLGNGILRDSVKPLEWTRRSSDSRIAWRDAAQRCERLRAGGHEDWRLPTLDELQSLYSKDFAETRCGDVTCRIYPQFELSGPWMWSSTLDGPSKAWLFDFFGGERFSADVGVHPERAVCARISGK